MIITNRNKITKFPKSRQIDRTTKPFKISTEYSEPTDTTRKAMIIAKEKELGLIPDDSPCFVDIDDLKNYLEED